MSDNGLRAENDRLRAELERMQALLSIDTADGSPITSKLATDVTRNVSSSRSGGGRSPGNKSGGSGDGGDRRTVRIAVLDTLEDVGLATYSREISQLLQAVYGRSVPATRFGVLSANETTSYATGRPKSVYLGHVLTAERFEPVKRLWIRSDWPLSERIFAPTTGRVRQLRMTIRLCQLADEWQDRAADPMMLRMLAADHASGLPGVTVRRGEFPLGDWSDIAADLLEELRARDQQARDTAADHLAQFSEQHQLYGPPQLVSVHDDPDQPKTVGGRR